MFRLQNMDGENVTRFEQLCQALQNVRREYSAYRDECFQFVGQFVTGLRNYLEAPEGFVSLFAKQGTFAGRKVDGPSSALHLTDDGYWHFGVAIDLFEQSGTMPYHCVGFEMRLKKLEQGFSLQIEDRPAFTIASAQGKELEPAFDGIFQFLKSRYENAFQDFIDGGGASCRFGF